MTLDEKLQALRDATQSLEPSKALTAKLAATLEPGSALTSATAAGAKSALPVTVKVLFVTLVLGAVGYAVYSLSTAAFAPGNWFGSFNKATVDAGSVKLIAGCPLWPQTGRHAPIPSPPTAQLRAATVVYPPGHERERMSELRKQLKKRPLTCTAQQQLLEQLLNMHIVGDAEEIRLVTRLGHLCPGAEQPFLASAHEPEESHCDNSNWCNEPNCSLEEESCARQLAQLSAKTCRGQWARERLSLMLCARMLQFEIEATAVRTASPDAWCLKDEVLKELAVLREHKRESP